MPSTSPESVETMNAKVKNQSQRGQVAVEYVLLLVVGVTVWLLIVEQLVSRKTESPGLIIQKWRQVLEVVGNDRIER